MRGKVWIGVAVSAVLLWVAVRGVSLDEVLQQLAEANSSAFRLVDLDAIVIDRALARVITRFAS
jgi:hypothetical protein